MATTRVRYYNDTVVLAANRIIVVAYPCGRHLPFLPVLYVFRK